MHIFCFFSEYPQIPNQKEKKKKTHTYKQNKNTKQNKQTCDKKFQYLIKYYAQKDL